MKKKTIEKIIQKKFEEWVSTIKDEQVKKLVKSNTIVTGGCIASMLLKEQINDFDIYFTNKETVKAVAQYYVDEYQERASRAGAKISVLDGDNGDNDNIGTIEAGRIKIYIKSDGIASESGKEKLFDTFAGDPEDSIEVIEKSEETFIDENTEGEIYRPIFLSSNAITLSNKIQIVVRFYGNPETIHQHYDYIHCTNYWLSETGQLVLKQPALESLMSRELVYVGSKYPVCSVIRTRKFLKRGWSINAGQYLKMCFQISKLDLTDLRTLEEQLTGVDAAYFGQLIDGLKKHAESEKESGKEFKLGYSYLASIIDKIF